MRFKVLGILIAGLLIHSSSSAHDIMNEGRNPGKIKPTNFDNKFKKIQSNKIFKGKSLQDTFSQIKQRPLRSSTKVVRIGYGAWLDSQVLSHMVKQILEKRLGKRVKLMLLADGLIYHGLAKGELDFTISAWLPETHAHHMNRYRGSLMNLGPIFKSAKLGIAVPRYMKNINTIKDLIEFEADKSFKIYGIEPGSGLTKKVQKALRHYGLRGKVGLKHSSTPGMLATLDKTYRMGKPIAVTAWRPHWKFRRYKLKFLEDPDGIISSNESIYPVCRRNLHHEHAQVVTLLDRLVLDVKDYEDLLDKAEKMGVEKAVTAYLQSHGQQTSQWL